MWWQIVGPRPLPIEWESSEDEWLVHLQVALGDLVELRGLRRTLVKESPEIPAPHFRVTLTSEPKVLPLYLLRGEPGVVAVINLDDDPTAEQTSDIWSAAIAEAIRRLGASDRAIEWLAFVGAEQTLLEGDLEIGGLALRAGDSVYIEHIPGDWPGFFSWANEWCFPVRIQGTVSGASWHTSRQQAGEDLNRLCALLSLCTDRPWRVLHFPQPLDQGDVIPPTRPNGRAIDLPTNEQALARSKAEIPDWLPRAWEELADAKLSGSLSAHYRAMRAENGDPATAMSLYVAAVEGVGAELVQLQRCELCGAQIGARRRFRAALELVHGDTEVRKLLKNYDLRSGAAHGSLIDGQPLSIDVFGGAGMFYVSPEHRLLGRIWDMRQASRKVLEFTLASRTEQDAGQPSW